MTAAEILARAAAGHSIIPDQAWVVIHELNRLTALVEGREYQPPNRRDEQLAIHVVTGFYVYVIAFDQDVFGTFATQQDAEDSLAYQIANGGPAWDDCEIQRHAIRGTPEVIT